MLTTSGGVLLRLLPLASFGFMAYQQFSTDSPIVAFFIIVFAIWFTSILFRNKYRGNLAGKVTEHWAVAFDTKEIVSLHLKKPKLKAEELPKIVDAIRKIKGVKKIRLKSYLLTPEIEGKKIIKIACLRGFKSPNIEKNFIYSGESTMSRLVYWNIIRIIKKDKQNKEAKFTKLTQAEGEFEVLIDELPRVK